MTILLITGQVSMTPEDQNIFGTFNWMADLNAPYKPPAYKQNVNPEYAYNKRLANKFLNSTSDLSNVSLLDFSHLHVLDLHPLH